MRIEEETGSATQSGSAEQRLLGLAVSPGIAIGPAHIVEGGDLPVAENHVPQSEIDAERRRFAEAVAASLKQLQKVKAKAAGLPGSTETTKTPRSTSRLNEATTLSVIVTGTNPKEGRSMLPRTSRDWTTGMASSTATA